MPTKTSTGTSGRFSLASTMGGKDFTGAICCSTLTNLYNADPKAQASSIVFSPEFIIANAPTISSGIRFQGLGLIRGFQAVEISRLINLKLITPLSAIIEADDDAFIARSVDLPVFGFGNDPIEALESLKREIESLCCDLMEDDNFSPQWLVYKAFLCDKIVTS
jgi:predicted RNase H-like HicB family nuclease